MLHTLEQEAAHYGMSLNHKTELMLNPAFPEPRWTFRHGDAVPTAEVVKYDLVRTFLGANLLRLLSFIAGLSPKKPTKGA